MRTSLKLITIYLLILCISCINNPESKTDLNFTQPISPHYISHYITNVQFIESYYKNNDKIITFETVIKGDEAIYSSSSIEYKQIAIFYGDTSFYRKDWTSIPVLAKSINSINLYCWINSEKEWINITDYVTINYKSFYPFILSGYEDEYIEGDFSESLINFNSQTILLLGNAFCLSIDKNIFEVCPSEFKIVLYPYFAEKVELQISIN